MTLGQLIHKLRKEACLSNDMVCKALGISTGSLSEIEGDKNRGFKFKTIDTLANFFHSDRDEIYKLGGKIPTDIYWNIVYSKKSYAEIREILKQAGV